ncbi:MAG: anti-sigma factor domain-containing protein [Ardenticatenaceae bacterium]
MDDACESIRDQLEAYAVGALEPEEQRLVERHLASCPHCQQLVQDYGEVLAALPEHLASVSPYHLPPELKTRVVQQVSDGPVPDMDGRASAPISHPLLNRVRASLPDGKRNLRGSTIAERLRTRVRRLRIATVALALLLFLALLWGFRLNVALAQERALRADIFELVGEQELVLEVIDSNQTTRSVLLPPPDVGGNAYGKIFARADMPHVVAMAARLPTPPAGQAYHLWVTEGDQTQLAGVMNVNDEGFGLLLYEAERDGPSYDAAQLTLQPRGDSTPAGNPVLVWPEQ